MSPADDAVDSGSLLLKAAAEAPNGLTIYRAGCREFQRYRIYSDDISISVAGTLTVTARSRPSRYLRILTAWSLSTSGKEAGDW